MLIVLEALNVFILIDKSKIFSQEWQLDLFYADTLHLPESHFPIKSNSLMVNKLVLYPHLHLIQDLSIP